MEVRGVAARAGRPLRWLISLALLAILVIGGLIALLLWPATPPLSDAGPPSINGESADASRPGESVPVHDDVCAVGEPHFRGSMPHDGLFHGGGLGMPIPAGLQSGDPARMPFGYDVAVLRSQDAETWAGVGAVRIDDPYLTPEQASSTVIACLAQADAGSRLEVLEARFVDIPGTSAAHERTGLLAQEGTSRDVRVLIADTGSPESLAVYVRVSREETPAAQALTDAESRLSGR